ncbi:MAG: hypothetical protein QOH97_2784 [Actinoplanes sp.]|jgi:hypothetical protein|nr:hypothetical protein [Actinoplanes sp.]
MITVQHRAAWPPAILAVLTATLALPAPAGAALPGFQVRLNAPPLFKAGANAKSVAAVVSTDTAPQCQKVRWSMLLKVADGVTLDDVSVTRIEDGAEFPLKSQITGDTALLTDVRLDPGVLCQGQTVTARYDISFDATSAHGAVAYQVQALNVRGQVLEQATATSQVLGTVAATPTPPRSASPSPAPSGSDDAAAGAPTDSPTDDAGAATVDPINAAQTEPVSTLGVPSLLGPGLIIGSMFMLVGIGILLRLRLRNRPPRPNEMPAPFYPAR